MKIRKVVSRAFGHEDKDSTVAVAINAAVSADVNEAGGRSRVSSRQRIVQRNGRTEVFEEEYRFDEGETRSRSRSKEDSGD